MSHGVQALGLSEFRAWGLEFQNFDVGFWIKEREADMRFSWEFPLAVSAWSHLSCHLLKLNTRHKSQNRPTIVTLVTTKTISIQITAITILQYY